MALLTLALTLVPIPNLLPSLFAAAPTHSITITPNTITIQTQTVSLVLSIPEKGAIVNVTNPMTGQFINMNQSLPNYLWAVDAFTSYWASASANQFSYTTSESGNSSTLVMNWVIQSVVSARAMMVASSDGSISMRMNVTNLSPTMKMKNVEFPYLGGIQSIGRSPVGNNIAIPEREGYVIENATSSIVADPIGLEYPGTLSMQFAYFYQNNLGGIYIGVHDNMSNYKGMVLFKDSSNAYGFMWYHYVANITAGGSFVMNYPVVFRGVVGADWSAGAEVYKEWATKQWYVSRGSLSQRTDVPAWVKNLDLVWTGHLYGTNQSNGHVFDGGINASEIPSYVRDIRSVLPNASIMVYFLGWNRDGFDRGYPEYYPPRDGTQTFQIAMASVHSEGMKSLLYFNGRLIDTATQTYNASKPYLTVDQNGNYYTETYNGGYLKAVVPDPATSWWQNTVINYSKPAVCEYGADGVYLDQISVASPKLDMSTNQGHLPGGGSWWWQAESNLLEGVRNAIRSCNPNAIISSENVNEVYIRDIDIFQSYDFLYDFTNMYPLGFSAPIFSYVYHGYVLQFTAFLAPTGLPSLGEGSYLHGITESITRGYVPGVDTFQSPLATNYFNPLSSSFLKTIVQARQEYKAFLTYGTTPEVPTFGTQQAQFSGLSIYPKSIIAPSIATGVFQTPDGREIIMQANRDPNLVSHSGTFTNGLPYSSQAALLTESTNNQTSEIMLVNTGRPFSVTIPSLSIETLTLEPAPTTKTITWQGSNYQYLVSSSSQIANTALNYANNSMTITISEPSSSGYFHIVLPRSLIPASFSAQVDAQSVGASAFQNSTTVSLEVTYGTGVHSIAISGLVAPPTTTTTTTSTNKTTSSTTSTTSTTTSVPTTTASTSSQSTSTSTTTFATASTLTSSSASSSTASISSVFVITSSTQTTTPAQTSAVLAPSQGALPTALIGVAAVALAAIAGVAYIAIRRRR